MESNHTAQAAIQTSKWDLDAEKRAFKTALSKLHVLIFEIPGPWEEGDSSASMVSDVAAIVKGVRARLSELQSSIDQNGNSI